MNKELINYFHVALRESDNIDINQVYEINTMAAKRGFWVEPSVCNKSVKQFLLSQPENINSTFYKDWSDIVSKTRLELAIDQVLHYATTYGTGFTWGNGYVPNDEPTEIFYKKLTPITEVPVNVLLDKCVDILESGVALKKDTMMAMVDFICEKTPKDYMYNLIKKINNKEAIVVLCDRYNIVPTNCFDMLRYIVYKAIGNPMLIQNETTYKQIMNSNFDLSILTNDNMVELSKIFLRYKNLILAFNKVWDRKIAHKNHVVTNRLRKLAKTYHTPLQQGYWQNIFQHKAIDDEELLAHVGELNNFQKIRLIEAVRGRLFARSQDTQSTLYPIRNGKVYMRSDYNKELSREFLLKIMTVVYCSLIDNIHDKRCIVKFPQGVTITTPSSEKSFVGNYPAGTSCAIPGEDAILGIYWKNEWGTYDFDLSVMLPNGDYIGWCGQFKNGGIVFSGDMTYADPEATELFYLPTTQKDLEAMMHVNRFTGQENSRYQLLVAHEKPNNFSKGYMVDPNNVLFRADMVSDAKQQIVAYISKGRVFLVNFGSGYGKVAKSKDPKTLSSALTKKMFSYIPLEDLLMDAGFVDFNELSPEKQEEHIQKGDILDLTDMTKDKILQLFA